jgi:hypothetical protein
MRVFPAMTRLLSSNRIADQRHWAIQIHRMDTPVVRFLSSLGGCYRSGFADVRRRSLAKGFQ